MIITKEIVYVDNGKIYKESSENIGTVIGKNVKYTTRSADGTESNYYTDPVLKREDLGKYDTLIPLHSEKKHANGMLWTKTYKSTKEYRDLLNIDTIGSVDITSFGVPLCPDVDIWGGAGFKEGDDNFIELYFNVTSSANMQDISSFYQLENPLSANNDLDSNRENWTIRSYEHLGVDLVLGSIVFEGETPMRLKIYKIEKEVVDG
jgi:hypothetical protein